MLQSFQKKNLLKCLLKQLRGVILFLQYETIERTATLPNGVNRKLPQNSVAGTH